MSDEASEENQQKQAVTRTLREFVQILANLFGVREIGSSSIRSYQMPFRRGYIGRRPAISLYHFTKIQKVPSIMRRGLQPHVGCHLVAYAPVVWLTEQRTRRDFPPGIDRDCRERGWRGSPTWICDRTLRLTISKPGVPIFPFIQWRLEQPFHDENCDMWFMHRFMSKWWIAFAPISPDCISVG